MQKWILIKGLCLIALVGFFLTLISAQNPVASQKTVILLTIKEAIGPATVDYVKSGIEAAKNTGSSAVIIQLDTPGGLDTAMREIIRDIIASPAPIITYVAPSGARAASAGTYILYASHIAAMAPGTNVGAATPVSLSALGGEGNAGKTVPVETTEERKVKNDALAYLRSLAELRGRNIPWTEKAIQQSASLTDLEALKSGVINVIAPDIQSLLQEIDGKTVLLQGQKLVLHTKGLKVVAQTENWRTRLLAVITNPNVAYILLLVGIYGLFFEFLNPGFVLPGVAGLIALLLALYAFQLLPINYAGLALILSGIAFLIAEVFFTSGVLAVGGIIAFIFGSILLFGTGTVGFSIAWSVIITVTVVTVIFFLVIVGLAMRARFRPIVSGREELIGSCGVIERIDEAGVWMRLAGELWQVRSSAPLSLNQKVIVTGRQGLVLFVAPQEAGKRLPS
ncbi:MAG TPA: nodulation protein NfeD [Gammaproteobacteria bacterium]|nr:nodulation protein NfeD [Gammaproteobacteria bacterium]